MFPPPLHALIQIKLLVHLKKYKLRRTEIQLYREENPFRTSYKSQSTSDRHKPVRWAAAFQPSQSSAAVSTDSEDDYGGHSDGVTMMMTWWCDDDDDMVVCR